MVVEVVVGLAMGELPPFLRLSLSRYRYWCHC